MLLISCIWYLALLCHLLSLDMLCVNATCLVSNYHICELCIAILLQDIIYVNYTMLSCCKGIIYVNYAMPCCLANHHVCELYHAIIFQYYMFHLSTTFVYSTALPVHQPFELVMEKSGVKTRSSEQAMVPVEAYISMVTGSSSEEDSETDDQSYIPPEVYALSCNVYISHMMHMVSCIAQFRNHMHNIEFYLLSLEIIHASASCLVYESIMSIISCHPVYLDNMYVNYFIPTYFRKTSYSFVMSSCLGTHHMLNYAIISC